MLFDTLSNLLIAMTGAAATIDATTNAPAASVSVSNSSTCVRSKPEQVQNALRPVLLRQVQLQPQLRVAVRAAHREQEAQDEARARLPWDRKDGWEGKPRGTQGTGRRKPLHVTGRRKPLHALNVRLREVSSSISGVLSLCFLLTTFTFCHAACFYFHYSSCFFE
jgi:hypothetical protein